jgi:predicted GNAT family acetyltransferase
MNLTVADAPGRMRYEIRADGQLAGFAAYRRSGDNVTFTHTEVDAAYEGRGVGGALARGALDDVRRAGGTVTPMCPFIRGWVDKHPDYLGLVRPGGA